MKFKDNVRRKLLIWKVIAILSVIVILSFSCYYGLNYIENKNQMVGYNAAIVAVNQRLWSTGEYAVFNETNSIPITCQFKVQ
jgi:hypothetical protein